MINIEQFFTRQLEVWPQAAEAYKRLETAMTRTVGAWRVQCNPSRIRSTGADTSAKAISDRPCFLCESNRPGEQTALDAGDYEILVNPFPIFRRHFTISSRRHEPQTIAGRVGAMLELAARMPGYTVFYNGPQCGASAPDHHHFQAVETSELPIWGSVKTQGVNTLGAMGYLYYSGDQAQAMTEHYVKSEPMVNILARQSDGKAQIIIIPRRKHRPDCYFDGTLTVSPASVDLAGVMILPREEDFRKITAEDVDRVLGEVCYSADELRPRVRVGIMTAPTIDVVRHADDTFTIRNVVIGKQFHWERTEDQTFSGDIELRLGTDGRVTAINTIPVEDYLLSVISSEMSATASREFLCAHAVISRSWLLAQLDHSARRHYEGQCSSTDEETVKWYDHDDHTDFDVCADDHCQRYQGITRASTPQVAEALAITSGQVLMHDGEICDARFSKCCGGVMEQFSTCWQPVDLPYLKALRDAPVQLPVPDLTTEAGARQWILTRPEAFCNTDSEEILSAVLNSYDRETSDFYRWQVDYTADELADIIRTRSGMDFGKILSLTPLHRGPSGRIDRLEIIGTNCRRIIGKELEIRRTLSRSHLYSSAFIVEPQSPDSQGVPATWTLRGAGWGHGVGLCQIGAAVMASEGYSYTQILSHYFPGAQVTKLY